MKYNRKLRWRSARAIPAMSAAGAAPEYHIPDPVAKPQAALCDFLEQRTDTGRMHLDAEEVMLRLRGGDVRRCLAHAETDLEYLWRGAAENRREIKQRRAIPDAPDRHQFIVVALLRIGDA